MRTDVTIDNPDEYITKKIKDQIIFAKTATSKEKTLAKAKDIVLTMIRKVDPKAFHRNSIPKRRHEKNLLQK